MNSSTFFLFMFLSSLLGLIFYWGNYLNLLLLLELMMLTIYLGLVILVSTQTNGGSDLMIFLGMVVCAGVYGLALLVYFSRQSSSNLFFEGNYF